MSEGVGASASAGRAVTRLVVAHLLAYPIAVAWAVGSVPLVVIAVASRYGTALEDDALVRKALPAVLAAAVVSFVAAHVLGVAWARARDASRGLRAFALRSAVLGGVAVVLGGASWLWLMTR